VFREGCYFLTDRPLETFESLELSPWLDYTGGPTDCRPNSGERAHRRRGASKGKCSGTHGGHVGGQCRGREGLRWRNDGEAKRAAELRGGSTAFRWLGCRRVVGK
jgi:hypothetical protein